MSPRKQSSMDEKGIARQMYDVAEQRARSYGLRLGDGADSDIRHLCQKAAIRLEKEPARLDEARAAFERLIDEMVVASKEIPGYREANPGVIGEKTLAWARGRLCPLYPIC